MNLPEFKNWLTIYCNRPKTREVYYSVISRFLKQHTEITQDTVNSYLSDMINKKASNTSINQFIYSMRKYAKFASLSLELPEPRPREQKVYSSLTYEELEVVLGKLEQVVKEPEKYKAILLFMFYTGLRRQELINLKRSDFDFDKFTVTINKSKTYKGKVVQLPESVIKIIKVYFLREREGQNAFNISYCSLYSILKRIGKMFNCPKKFSPHSFRRACARHLFRITNNDYRIAKKQLGHSNIATTMSYAEITKEESFKMLGDAFKKKLKNK